MNRVSLDSELLSTYIKDKLWEQDPYYYSLLELVVETLVYDLTINRKDLLKIHTMSTFRKRKVLEKAFPDNGTVQYTVEEIPPIKETLWQRVKNLVAKK